MDKDQKTTNTYNEPITGTERIQALRDGFFRHSQGAFFRRVVKTPSSTTIQQTILVSFSLVSFLLLFILGIVLYQVFARQLRKSSVESRSQIAAQAVVNLEDYLVNMRRISDAMYYDVIKGKDFARENVDQEMTLIYEGQKDNLISFALFDADGNLVSAAPIDNLKQGLDVTKQDWFIGAMQRTENIYFSTPHVQNLFWDPSYRYNWVLSLSRAVELTRNGTPMMGVLLVDMNYSTIEQMMERLNTDTSGQYAYLTDSKGNLIYHPRQNQILSNLFKENNIANAHYADGTRMEEFHGSRRTVIVDTVAYTGWKLISVIPESAFGVGIETIRFVIILIVAIALLIFFELNRLIARRISQPIRELNDSIRDMESGNLVSSEIRVGGSQEVQHLGRTLRSLIDRINQLMDDIVIEQEEKRKSEMDALQSQINPHFLYNTLDSIVWMIESARNKEAVFMVTQLASLFRISLSRGRNIIPIEQELRHAENYMNIQKVRFKDAFQVHFEIDPEIRQYAIVKLVIQPILENAIYYGVGEFDPDDDGEIRIRAWQEPSKLDPAQMDVYLSISDNGYGMTPEVRDNLLKDTPENRQHKPKHGSGVGLVNVHSRLKLRFGEEYGLQVESEPDEGTTVTIHIPAVLYNEENAQELESGHYRTSHDETHAGRMYAAWDGSAGGEQAVAQNAEPEEGTRQKERIKEGKENAHE